ncbi:MAG: hypothetical protein H6739_38960 [Alphaproteobacteria bacterium]|nr:hypothetical protein [Alphaproteobacteria bacterium]
MASRSTLLRRRIKAIVQAILAFTLTAGFYLGPLAAAVLVGALEDTIVSELPLQRTVDYMASMSMIPFPEPNAEVIEVTQELLEPPSSKEATEPPPEPERADSSSTAPVKPQDGPGKKIEAGEQSQKTPPPGSTTERSGGKVKGPTQDGEGARAQDCLPDNPDIRAMGDHRYRVKQDLIDYYVNHLREASALAVTAWQKGGQGDITGFRVFRLRCGNDLYQLGFRGGDLVQEVNGEPVTTTRQAIGAYLRLRNEKRLEVTIKRRKEIITLRYRLV